MGQYHNGKVVLIKELNFANKFLTVSNNGKLFIRDIES